MIVLLAIVMLWMTWQIRNVTGNIVRFARETLGFDHAASVKGDEIEILNSEFQTLTQEVVEARERLKRQAEELLREKTIYLDSVLHSSTMAIVATDRDMRVKYFNDMAEKFCECSAENARGERIEDTPFLRLYPVDFLKESMEEIGRGGEAMRVLSLELFGRPAYFETRCTGIMDNEGNVAGYLFITADVTERVDADEKLKKYAEELELKNTQLNEALSNIKVLSGMIPICASCKKVRTDEDFWQSVESYISSRSDATFSHGICPDCARELYPEVFKDDSDLKEE
jgi:PAS domain S-box-containing protein